MIAILLYAIDGHAQSEYRIPLPDSIVPIDILSIDGTFIHIICQNGIYELNGSVVSPYIMFDDMDLSRNLSVYMLPLGPDQYPSYPVIQGGYISIINKDSIVKSVINASPQSVNVTKQEAKIDLNNTSVLIGNTEISAQSIEGSEYKAAIQNRIHSKIKQHHITGALKVYEKEDSTIKVLTSECLYTISEKDISIDYKVDQDTTEELLSLVVDNNDNTWLLSNKSISILTPQYLHKYDLPKGNKLYQPYSIRNRLYCSNGLNVMQKHDKQWKIRNDLIAPKNIVISEDGDPYLIYSNKAEKLSKINAKLQERTAEISGELIEDINGNYICTSKAVYKDRVRINQTTDHYYKAIIHNDKLIVIGQSGIYAYANNQFGLLKSTQIPKSKNYFIQDGHIFYFSDNSIHHIEIDNPENEGIIALRKSKVLDILSTTDHMVVLTTQSVLYLDKKILLRDRIVINKVIPISPELTEAILSPLDGKLWVSTVASISLINAENSSGMYLPTLSLTDEHNQNYINTSLKSNNFHSNNINYTYYVNTPEGTKTIWTKDPNITIDRDQNTNVNIIAKMNDDVFARDIYSNDVTIMATKSTLLDRMIKIIAAILTTLLILWAIRKRITT